MIGYRPTLTLSTSLLDRSGSLNSSIVNIKAFQQGTNHDNVYRHCFIVFTTIPCYHLVYTLQSISIRCVWPFLLTILQISGADLLAHSLGSQFVACCHSCAMVVALILRSAHSAAVLFFFRLLVQVFHQRWVGKGMHL